MQLYSKEIEVMAAFGLSSEQAEKAISAFSIVNAGQNCRIRNQSKLWGGITALQARAVFRKPDNVIKPRKCVIGYCSVGGSRGRIEWCIQCNQIL